MGLYLHKKGEHDNKEDESPECTENLLCPKVSPSYISKFIYTSRYNFIKYLCCPVPLIPYNIPIMGGRTIIEWVVFALVTFVFFISAGGVAGSGGNASILGFFTVWLGCRSNNILTIVFGISFERAIFWHKIVAILAIAVSLLHGFEAGFEDFAGGRRRRRLEDEGGDERTQSGVILLILMGAIALTYIIKHLFFELFYYLHILLYLVILYFAFIHGATAFAFAVVLWGIDLAFRYFLLHNAIDASYEILPADVIKIKFPKPFHYNALQYIFINVPELSYFEYHPFTLSSAPHEDHVSVHIRVLGNWTKKLRALGVKKMDKNEKTIKVNVEGPFGLPSINLKSQEYEVYLLITGGIGVTPAQSLYKDIIHRHSKNKWPLRKLIFIWSVRDKSMFQMDLNIIHNSIADKKAEEKEDIEMIPKEVTRSSLKNNIDGNNDRGSAFNVESVYKLNDSTTNDNGNGNTGNNSSSHHHQGTNPNSPSIHRSPSSVTPLPISFQPNLIFPSPSVDRDINELMELNTHSPRSIKRKLKNSSGNNNNVDVDIENNVNNDTSDTALANNSSHHQNNNNKIVPTNVDLKASTTNDSSIFAPNVKKLINDESPVHVEFFLTQAKKNVILNDLDPISREKVFLGRPDLSEQFNQVSEMCREEEISRVAVITCGPAVMVAQVADLCRQFNNGCGGFGGSRGGVVQFDLHVEEFNL